MRNFEKYAAAGEAKMKKHRHFDMTTSDFFTLTSKMESGEFSIYDVISMTFYAGVEAGSRIEKKNQAQA